MQPATARSLAATLVGDLREHDAEALRLGEVDLGAALEQQLFFALRDDRRTTRGGRAALARLATRLGPVAAAAVGVAAGWRVVAPGADPIVVLVRDPAHYPVLALIEAALQRDAGRSLAMLRVGRAAAIPPAHAVAPRLVELARPSEMRLALGHRGRAAAALAAARPAWDGRLPSARAADLRRIADGELARIALGAAGLRSAVERWRPSLLVALDEIGTWARLVPAVGRRMNLPTLDLPHAETADPIAIRGAAYDHWAVYGPRAVEVLGAAGIGPERIHAIGAPRFDPLVAMLAERPPTEYAIPGRVVFAAQYVTGRMTAAALRETWAAAVAAAAAIAPAELVVIPHPAEPPGTAAALAAGGAGPAVELRLAPAGSLHAELPGAALLVTGWSNSVFEAAIAGVPAIAVDPGGIAPVDFAADGLAVAADGPAAAASAARSLADAATRREAVARARAVASERLGALDGRASERAAALMLSVARIPDA